MLVLLGNRVATKSEEGGYSQKSGRIKGGEMRGRGPILGTDPSSEARCCGAV